MLYVIICEDSLDSLERRLVLRPQHLKRLQQLQDEGRLEIAGPLPAIDSPEPGPAGPCRVKTLVHTFLNSV